MSRHQDEDILKRLQSSRELMEKFADLEHKLSADLHQGFEQNLGIPIPTAIDAEVLKIDTAMKYSTELKIDEFVTGAFGLATAAFSGNEAEIATKAVQVATTAIKAIFGSTSVQVGVQGSSAKILHKKAGSDTEEVHVAACFASTAFCSKEQWFTQTDFYISRYIFTVFEIVRHRDQALLRLKAV